jgi:hypothetical protein
MKYALGKGHMSQISISRRKVLRSTGFVLAAPLVGALPVRAATTSSTSSSTATPSYIGFSQDLMNWVQDDIGNRAAESRNGIFSSSRIKNLSKSLRLYAHHLETTGLDPDLRQVAQRVDLSTVQVWPDKNIDAVYYTFRKYMPDITREDVRGLCTSGSQDVKTGLSKLSLDGLSGFFYAHADSLQKAASLLTANDSSAVLSQPSITHAMYNRQHEGVALDLSNYDPLHSKVHLLRVCSHLSKKLACAVLNNSYTDAAITDALSAIVSALVGGTVTSVCAGAGILVDVITAGGAVILSPLEALLCGGAGTAAASATALYIAHLGLVEGINYLNEQLKQELGC